VLPTSSMSCFSSYNPVDYSDLTLSVLSQYNYGFLHANPLTVVSDSYIKSVQCHPGLTYIFNFWHSGTLALRASARVPECQKLKM